MIDPANITRFDCNDRYLEEVAFFFIAAAGKNGTFAAKVVNDAIFNPATGLNILPSKFIRFFNDRSVEIILRYHGLGCYRSKSKAMKDLAYLIRTKLINLRTCSTKELEVIKGIGPKTSRGIIMHTRRGARCACLDRHILSFLREQGIDAPKNTPSSLRLYIKLEHAFLEICDKLKKEPAELDLEIWNDRKTKSHD